MSCKIGNTYNYDSLNEYILNEDMICSSPQNIIQLKTPISGQILTLQSGVEAWTSSKGDTYQIIPNSGHAYILESGTNLYSYAFGLSPISISGSGLPNGLTLSSFNTINGIPTTTGSYICNLKYIYSYCNQTYTGVNKQITINICNPVDEVESYGRIFSNNLGPKFNYDPLIEYSNLCISGVPLLSIVSGQRLVLESGVDAWLYTQYNTDYTFITGRRQFTLFTGTNLFTNSTGIEPSIISGDLPANLQFKDYCTITGIPDTTGKWTCAIKYGYCGNGNFNDTIYGQTKNISIEVLLPSEIDYTEGILYMGYSNTNTIPYNQLKVKNIDFYYNQNNRFTRYFENITGYGDNIIKTISGSQQPFFGLIDRPTGWLPAMMYQTGVLTGLITDGNSSFSWSDVLITGTGDINKVYLNNIIGYKQAVNIIEFNTGLLNNGDILNINGLDFLYTTELNDSYDYQFNSLNMLINILNSGATGALNASLKDIVGVTGYLNGSNLVLYSYKLLGENGNSIKIYRNTKNIDSIKIPYRYFVSGETLREPTNTWSGIFTNFYYTITKEKSGIYLYNYIDNSYYDTLSGVAWEDNFSGNYYITTGILDITNSLNFTGSLVPFINNIYFGNAIIPSGQNFITSGFSISIRKPNYYNISGNISKYTVSGSDFLYTGLIEG